MYLLGPIQADGQLVHPIYLNWTYFNIPVGRSLQSMKARFLLALLVLSFHTGCEDSLLEQESGDVPSEAADGKADAVNEGGLGPGLRSLDEPETVDVGVWNLAWFGDEEHGPSDEQLQQHNVATVLAALRFDILGLVEVVSEDAFSRLLADLPGYHGLLVTDPSVALGSEFYWSGEQKVALLVRDRFEIESARVILPEHAWDFGGRPPMEVKLRFWEDGKRRTLVVIVAHFKAMASADGYARRVASAAALEDFLSSEYPTRWVMVIGDFNDDIDTSTYFGHASPFAQLADSPNYRFATDALSEDGVATTTHFSATIDHHLVTDDLAERFVEGSARVLRVDAHIEDYDQSTSDHYPVLTRYDLR